MQLGELAKKIGARICSPGRGARVDLQQVFAGDRISDLLNAAGDHALLVTNVVGAQLLRVAELMDVPGICLVGGQEPDAALRDVARAHGTLLMVSPYGLFETCGRIHARLTAEAEGAE